MGKPVRKTPAPRPSMQLLIDRELVRKFKALCVLKGTSMSKVVTLWATKAVAEQSVPVDK